MAFIDEWSEKIKTNRKSALVVGIAVVGLILVGGLAFAAGRRYTHFHQGAFNRHNSFGFPGRPAGGHRRFFGGQRPVFGSVTKLGNNQFDLQTNGGTTETAILSSSTQIINNGSSVGPSDIKVGESVAVFGTVNGTQISATRVIINPTARGLGAPVTNPNAGTD